MRPTIENSEATMHDRLASLESRLSRGRLCSGVPWLILAALVLSGWSRSQDPPEQIVARSFIVKGEAGSGELSIDAGGRPQLVLRDREDLERVMLHVQETGDTFFRMLDRDGTTRAELSVLDEATPRLMLNDRSGQDRLKLFLMPDGSSLIYMKDSDGRNRVEMANTVTNLKGFVTFDDASQPRMILGELPGAAAALWMREGPLNLFELTMNPATGAAMTLRDSEGATRWSASVNDG